MNEPITCLSDLRYAVELLLAEAKRQGHDPDTVYVDPPLRLRLHPTVLTDDSVVFDIHASTDDADRHR